MSIAGFTMSGVTFQGGSTIQKMDGGGGGGNGSNGVILYADMNPPITPGAQLQDSTATVNGTTGFTINNGIDTGVAVMSLSAANQTYFNNLGLGTHTATFSAGSTHATASVNITHLPNGTGGGGPGGASLVFFIDSGISYPATFNFPITIS